ncbi:D-alanine--D-alanine ligase family protein [Arhodomonas sp. SL1]|uniref:D-alanine--D-alanine ligase family protein n=1 Tax=Arhodomonas sp. SL1 TaxID=3425691 RepID=UPI003F885559
MAYQSVLPPQHGDAVIDITVVLGDPDLPYSYNPSNRFEPQDHLAVRRLKEALSTLGEHRFRFLEDHSRLWESLDEGHPALVLNFCNTGYRNKPSHQHHIASMLEMLELPYAGAAPETMVLCHHKFLVSTLAADLGVPVPRQMLVDSGDADGPLPEDYPVFIKANGGDGSIGIGPNSVVHGPEETRRCLSELHALLPGQFALIQDYLPGPEYSIGVFGNAQAGFTALPPLQIDFSALASDLPPIMTYDSKVNPDSPYWQKVRFQPTESEDARRRMTDAATRLFERLGCRDYARMDFRADAAGVPRLIDVNAHPMWGEGGMLATMTGYQGRSYPQMLESIIEAARARSGLTR